MKATSLRFAWLLCLLLTAGAAEAKVYVTELGFGHVRRIPDTGRLETDQGAMGSGRWIGAEVEFLDETRRIPALLTHGLSTGIQIEGVPAGENNFRLEVTHPTFRFPDGRVSDRHEELLTLTNAGQGCFFEFTYFFDKEFERQPGQWVIKLFYGGEMIYHARFTVYQPWDT
ncbi:MAG: DUF3859 domain-containing protein [Opitutales bacterium]